MSISEESAVQAATDMLVSSKVDTLSLRQIYSSLKLKLGDEVMAHKSAIKRAVLAALQSANNSQQDPAESFHTDIDDGLLVGTVRQYLSDTDIQLVTMKDAKAAVATLLGVDPGHSAMTSVASLIRQTLQENQHNSNGGVRADESGGQSASSDSSESEVVGAPRKLRRRPNKRALHNTRSLDDRHSLVDVHSKLRKYATVAKVGTSLLHGMLCAATPLPVFTMCS